MEKIYIKLVVILKKNRRKKSFIYVVCGEKGSFYDIYFQLLFAVRCCWHHFFLLLWGYLTVEWTKYCTANHTRTHQRSELCLKVVLDRIIVIKRHPTPSFQTGERKEKKRVMNSFLFPLFSYYIIPTRIYNVHIFFCGYA